VNDWTLTLLLILCQPTNELPTEADPGLRQAMKDVAHLLDLWPITQDSWGQNYGSDLCWCQCRQRELYDAPPAEDRFRLPPRKVIGSYLEMNYHYTEWASNQYGLADYFAVEASIADANQLREFWTAALEARTNIHPRAALKKMRIAIGESAYYNGEWPPWVPTWRFRQIR